MKKSLIKICALAVCACVAFVSFSGCGRERGQAVDESKTQLKIGVWDGGLGYAWCENIARKFENLYAEHHFEEGKKGIQITIEPSKSLASNGVADYIKDSEYDIIFEEQTNYTDFINKGAALDITELVTTPLTEFGETKSIEDKLSTDNKNFYGNGLNDDKYYAVPWYESYFGINYDIELFEQKCFYIAAKSDDGGNPDSYGCVKTKTAKRGNGPDGVYGTEDDGLPATYAEFYKMCDKMVSLQVVPILWSGKQTDYMILWTLSAAADYEGYEQYKLNYTLDGTAENLISVDESGLVTELPDISINERNGYELGKQAGKYYALKFLDGIINTKVNGETKYIDAVNQSFSNSMTHKGAQGTYLGSKYESDVKTVAMLFEGSWWYTEATPYFNMYSSQDGGSITERKIGFMPMPKASEDRLGEATLLDTWITNALICSRIPADRLEAAKLFFRYCHTDENLSGFTRDANVPRPFVYEMSEADKEISSPYAKQLMSLHNSAKIVYPWSLQNIVANNTAAFSRTNSAKIGNAFYQYPTTALYAGITPEAYFAGISNYMNSDQWSSSYSQYYSE